MAFVAQLPAVTRRVSAWTNHPVRQAAVTKIVVIMVVEAVAGFVPKVRRVRSTRCVSIRVAVLQAVRASSAAEMDVEALVECVRRVKAAVISGYVWCRRGVLRVV